MKPVAVGCDGRKGGSSVGVAGGSSDGACGGVGRRWFIVVNATIFLLISEGMFVDSNNPILT